MDADHFKRMHAALMELLERGQMAPTANIQMLLQLTVAVAEDTAQDPAELDSYHMAIIDTLGAMFARTKTGALARAQHHLH